MAEAYIIDAVRTPVGRKKGSLAAVHPADLGAHPLKELVKRTGIDAGAVDDVVATWREVLADRATVLRREEAVARGWFGPVGTGVLPRIGDVVAACHGDHAVLSTAEWGYEATLVGLHGSLTPEEMLIPVLVD